MADLFTLSEEARKAVQAALDATQLENEVLYKRISQLEETVAQQRLDLIAAQGFIAQQDQLIRFQTLHVPADLVYPEPFDRMIRARKVQ